MTDLGSMPMSEALAHYGVLGMKWGKRRAKASAVEVRAARGRVRSSDAKLRVAEKKAAQIKDAGKRAAAKAEFNKMKVDHLNNPDRVIASRLTRGEKAVAIGATVYTGGLLGIVAVAGTSAHSRRIEQKQEKGTYTKKG